MAFWLRTGSELPRLVLLLLVAAGLFARTLGKLNSVELGFNREHLLLFGVNARQAGYRDQAIAQFLGKAPHRSTRLAAPSPIATLRLFRQFVLSEQNCATWLCWSSTTKIYTSRPPSTRWTRFLAIPCWHRSVG
jgi:hypothetical protein